MSRTLQLAEQLISRPSVTPDDAGCQQILGERLAQLGFTLETIESGPADFRVTNLWAVRRPANAVATKTLVFAGHTDVVPTGPVEQWTSHPFTPTHRDGKLYGRGACDMKTSVAAFVTSIEEFLQAAPEPKLTLALLLTSDEEGPGVDGTVIVCNALAARGEVIDYCIVGEPTAVERCGDMIKNGRRGTMSGKLTVKGVQGHIAYPHLAKNPVHSVAPALAELVAINAADGWDTASNPYFQPTSWQISNFHSGTGASNVIPGSAVIDFNFRFSTESTPESLQQRVHAVLDAHKIDYTLAWTIGGLPFLTTPGELVTAVQGAIRDETGIETELSTSGGTSDARFIAKICKQVVELGPVNASIHKIDEHIDVAEIETLKNIYVRTLKQLDAALAA
ncbi:succinyldiaminopimelate desuccinylase [Variovorax sp. YR634]|uniref:succinyl-diaminopimelate desuccinylase n=1 Tax=unclassified Variovorax TaxID=663243 RepID=UPI000899BF99|nr:MULTISPECIES: succinyl-diaminopimelate desuccinylase [unclassified Variovorax]SDX56153.1 succinyldiaminopimelate desuccinylase [Variovorax sp. YR634]SOD28290.1 succinyldiaminopimelate desuccinylase [Variovorax sp. YR752]